MGKFNGIGGSVIVGTVTVSGMSEWSLDASMSPAEVTEFGESDDTYVASTRNRTGSFSGSNWQSDAGQGAIYTAFDAGDTVALKLYEDASHYWTIGTAFITGVSDSISVKGAAEKTYSFQVSGGVSYT